LDFFNFFKKNNGVFNCLSRSFPTIPCVYCSGRRCWLSS
jgi:hypothetical protein